jgi:hypothetical protein
MIRRLVGACVLLACAAVLVLFAHDTWHWSRALRDGDARAAAGYTPPEAWDAATALPAGLVRGLLRIDDDLGYRRTVAAALREDARAPDARQPRERTVLESALVRISRTDASPARAASAADDLGVLFYYDPPTPSNAKNPYQDPTQGVPSGALSPSQKALAEFQLAARLDPTNTVALRNLEVLLREVDQTSKVDTPRHGAGENAGTKGSGSRLPGHGY